MRYAKSNSNSIDTGFSPRLLYVTRQDFHVHQHERPLHSHDSLCEIHFCYQGAGCYTINGVQHSVRSGDLMLANKNEEHELLSTSEKNYGGYCFGYTDVRFDSLEDNCLVPANHPHICGTGRDFPLLFSLAEQIMDRNLKNSLDRQLLESLSLTFLLFTRSLAETPRQSDASIKRNEAVTAIKSYIAAHFKEDLTLETIAEALSFSTSYLTHSFKKATGYSVMEYVIRRRIGYAETLLISSDFSVTEIALMCGYDNISHFQTTFKRVAGITPLQFRKRYLKELRGERDQR